MFAQGECVAVAPLQTALSQPPTVLQALRNAVANRKPQIELTPTRGAVKRTIDNHNLLGVDKRQYAKGNKEQSCRFAVTRRSMLSRTIMQPAAHGFIRKHGREVLVGDQRKLWRCPVCAWWRDWSDAKCCGCGASRDCLPPRIARIKERQLTASRMAT